ncbi:MAG TPA: P-loop NTPase fold protein [Chloroflexia bacterium]|nr:P-loop NTPase fold protein [Chloroflexia bacterium]
MLSIQEGVGSFPVALYRGGQNLLTPDTKDASAQKFSSIAQEVQSPEGPQSPSEGPLLTSEEPLPDQQPPRSRTWLAVYNADGDIRSSKDEELSDLLDVTSDVKALATLIASRKLAPPLSIGLFGEWGSGKSFFMQLLRGEIEKRAEAAVLSRKPQREVMFYKHIRQIEFNAWQYMEGDLWASLVAHIFDGLVNDDRDNVADEVRTKRLQNLGVQQAAEAAAKAREEQAKVALSAAQAELKKAQGELRVAEANVLAITPRTLLTAALNETQVQGALRSLRTALGLDEKLGTDLEETYNATQVALRRSQSLLGSLLGGGNRIWWLLLIPVISILAGIAAAIITAALGSAWFAQTAALIASLSGLIAGAVAWLRKQVNWASGWLAKVQEAQDTLEKHIAEGTLEVRKTLAKRNAAVEAAYKRVSEAQEAKAKAQQQVALAEGELRNASPERLLASFLEERVESTDYRKRLGILALIRQDFKMLSDLLSANNRKLEEEEENEEEPQEQESLDKVDDVSINRIVLYIDDLDRCPPETVVKVLQAVNLLLGLPLFVVVVAVDARWVRGSLLSRYTGLLRNDLAPSNANDTQDMLASPLDYLEKIFQIPFWLSPISESGRRKMLDALLTPMPATSKTVRTQPIEQPAPTQVPTQSVLPQSDAPHTSTGAKQDSTAPGPPAGPVVVEVARDNVDLNPEAMTVQHSELEFIHELAPLLGRSPRALKRFVNTYMLIKVRVGDGGSLLGAEEDPEFKVVLVLLALVTHSPDIASSVFQAIDYHTKPSGGKPPISITKGRGAANSNPWKTIRAYVEANNHEMISHPDRMAQWTRVAAWLEKHEAGLPTEWERLDMWVQRIARYAYVADPNWLS